MPQVIDPQKLFISIRCLDHATFFPPGRSVWCTEKNDHPYFEMRCCHTQMCNTEIVVSVPVNASTGGEQPRFLIQRKPPINQSLLPDQHHIVSQLPPTFRVHISSFSKRCPFQLRPFVHHKTNVWMANNWPFHCLIRLFTTFQLLAIPKCTQNLKSFANESFKFVYLPIVDIC